MPAPAPSPADLVQSGQAAERSGRPAEAERLYRAALAADPANGSAHAALGFLALRSGRPELAQRHLARAGALLPDLFDQQRREAERLSAARRWRDAAEAWQRALALRTGEPLALLGFAEALAQLGHPGAAAAAENAAALRPDDPTALLRAAAVLAEAGRLDRSGALAERAQALAPASPAPPLRLGQIRRDQGRIEEARTLYRRALSLDPDHAEAWLQLSEVHDFRSGAAGIGRMEALLSRIGEADPAAIPLLFALGKAYDDIGEYDRAFARLDRANRLRATQLRYDPAQDEAWAERILKGIDAELLRAKAGAGDPSPLPLFILGMPRSGSSLAEQILAQHPDLHAAGEIAEVGRMLEDLARLRPGAADYLAACAAASGEELRAIGGASVERLKALAPGKARVTNKTPGNLFHVGFIHLALPHARFVLTRRDAVDTCFACWRMPFRSGVAFSYDLRHVARYYRLQERLTAHWRALLPERILSFAYEALIADPEAEARRLVQFAGLAWEPQCLEFQRSDRPVLTASGVQLRQGLAKEPHRRWRNYERHLGPLLEELGELAG